MLFESSVSPAFHMDLFKPDFAIPLIIYVTFFMGPRPVLSDRHSVSGFIQEGLSSAPTGINYVREDFYFSHYRFYEETSSISIRNTVLPSYAAPRVVLESFLFLTLSLLAKGETGNVYNILYYAIPNAIFTGFVSIFIYSLHRIFEHPIWTGSNK